MEKNENACNKLWWLIWISLHTLMHSNCRNEIGADRSIYMQGNDFVDD